MVNAKRARPVLGGKIWPTALAQKVKAHKRLSSRISGLMIHLQIIVV